MKYVIWGANLSGGFLRANVEQTKEGSVAYNRKLVQLAEQYGVDSVLFATRYVGAIGGSATDSGQLDPLTLISAIAHETKKIRFIAAVLPGFLHPATLAKIGTTIDIISNGRFHINLVSGWFKEEQEMFGIEWIKHEDRYKRSTEYLEVLKGLWTEESFSYEGDFYQLKEAVLTPKPIQKPYPSIYQGGNSKDSQEMAAKLSDVYFMNGAPAEELKEQMQKVSAEAKKYGRKLQFAVNAFVIARDTDEEAIKEHEYIVAHADDRAIAQVKARTETKGMWKNAKNISDFVANNEGFRTGLIGSYLTVAEKIKELEAIGVDQILLTFRKPLEELPLFFREVKPLVEEEENGALNID
ncbi:LLM class flavin-dependent oxidoreductase [Alkalihalobacillus sp. 1P02AB]|uniref:LLM class flavin-dependent oxidoreductase n=1 Tax=Alkalihalobacillus sp. 1P02AB TaxID=3132260 RepID=UPI0039A66E92